MIDKITKFVITLIHNLLRGLKADSSGSDLIGPAEELAITFVIEYCILAFMALLIAANVQSFLKKLLFTLKNILRDNNI